MKAYYLISCFGLLATLTVSCVQGDSQGEAQKFKEKQSGDSTLNKSEAQYGSLSEDLQDDGALFKSCEKASNRRFAADLVRISDETTRMPQFEDLRPLGKICMQQLNMSSRYLEGFPGNPDLVEYFGLSFSFQLQIKNGGEYAFELNSDDGSLLTIDGSPVIDNDGLHLAQAKTTSIVLSPGTHTVKLKYFQAVGEAALELKWKAPGDQEFDYIPLEFIRR